MNKEIRAKIFGLYLGCDICMPDGHTATIVSVGLDEFNSIEHSTGSYGIHHYNGEEKLLLHDLRDITDEDLTIVAELLGCKDYNSIRYEASNGGYFFIDYISKRDCNKYAGIDILPFQVADYLRSRGYMLPYNGIDLFEADIAKRKEG